MQATTAAEGLFGMYIMRGTSKKRKERYALPVEACLKNTWQPFDIKDI